MEDNFALETLREKLIIAGINEIRNHGIVDFSLRRVASECGASCAAPYRHFENKNELILEIIKFINNQWLLLENQIVEIYKTNTRKLILELCLANVRFKLANPDFRAVLTINENNLNPMQRTELSRMNETISVYIIKYAAEENIPADKAKQKLYVIKSLVYGAVIQAENGEISSNDEMIKMVKESIEEVL